MPDTKDLVARPDGSAAAKRRGLVRRALHRVMRWRRVLRIAAQRLRPATVSTPRKVAWSTSLAASWPERGANLAGMLGPVGDDCGPGQGERDVLADFDVLDEQMRSLGEAADDLSASRSSRSDVEIADVDIDLSVDLARDGVDNNVDGV